MNKPYDINALEKFLIGLENFYKSEPGDEKKGIGHEIEHINGVILRSKKYVEMINENPEAYKLDKKVDIGKATVIAALHDIGNVIERDYHNHYAFAIVKGELSVEDFCSVPFEIDKNEFADEKFIKSFKAAINNKTFIVNNISEDNKIFLKALSKYYTAKLFFDIAYKPNNLYTEKDLDEYIKQEFPEMPDAVLTSIKKNLCNEDHSLKIQYNPKLKEITKELNSIFDEKSIEEIAQAVQDHNIDYSSKGKRYQSRSIYGSIVSDADKDNVPEVFALRTIMYAANKLGLQKKLDYVRKKDATKEEKEKWNSDFVPNLKQCSKHVLHQSWERCRESFEDFFKRTGLLPDKRPTWNEIGKYKKDFSGTKGLEGISKSIPVPENSKELEEMVKGYNYAIVDDKLYLFTINLHEGEDLYSELDKISGKSEIRNSRKKYIDTVQGWSKQENEKESLEFIVPLAEEWAQAKSNEEIINKYEAKYCKECITGQMKNYCFENIIKICLVNGSEEGYKDVDTQISKMTEYNNQERINDKHGRDEITKINGEEI